MRPRLNPEKPRLKPRLSPPMAPLGPRMIPATVDAGGEAADVGVGKTRANYLPLPSPVRISPNCSRFMPDPRQPIRSADAIVEKLEALLLDPARLRAMKAAALARAATHRWENYRRGLVAAIRQTLGDAPPCP